MAEEPDVQESNEITLDDFNADEQDTGKAESSTVKEETKPEVAKEPEAKEDAEAGSAEADDAETEEVKAEDSEETDGKDADDAPAEETDKPQGRGFDSRKYELTTEIRDLVAQRNAIRRGVEQDTAQIYQAKTADELVEEGYDATEAKILALEQRQQIQEHNNRIADTQLTIESESQRILNEFPIFNPESSDYDKELSLEAADLLENSLVFDKDSGQLIDYNQSPYKIYKTLARASGISANKAQIKGQEAVEKKLANADASTSSAPTKKAKDPLMELWSSDD